MGSIKGETRGSRFQRFRCSSELFVGALGRGVLITCKDGKDRAERIMDEQLFY